MSCYARPLTSEPDICFESELQSPFPCTQAGLTAFEANPPLRMELPWSGAPTTPILPMQRQDDAHYTSNAFPSTTSQRTTSPLQTSTSRGSSHTRKMAPGHIKRPCNAFILFRSHAVATNLVPKEVERDHRNISRIISHMWRSLDKSERALWEAKAVAEKERHHREHPDYKYRPGSRRTNIHRRNVRKLSSTERQCEQIADVILKACGRAGVERRPSTSSRGRASPRTHMSSLMPPHPMLRRSFSTDAIGIPPVRLERAASKANVLDLPTMPASQPGHLDVWPAAMPRRSSSAPPPFLRPEEQATTPESGVCGDFLGSDDVASDALHWILNTPLLSADSSPYEHEPAMLATTPVPDAPDFASVASPCAVQDDTIGVEHDFHSFSLDAPAPACAPPGLLDLTSHQVPEHMLPPISPKCIHNAPCWSASSIESLPLDSTFTQIPTFGTLASWESTIGAVFPTLNAPALPDALPAWDNSVPFPMPEFGAASWPGY